MSGYSALEGKRLLHKITRKSGVPVHALLQQFVPEIS